MATPEVTKFATILYDISGGLYGIDNYASLHVSIAADTILAQKKQLDELEAKNKELAAQLEAIVNVSASKIAELFRDNQKLTAQIAAVRETFFTGR